MPSKVCSVWCAISEPDVHCRRGESDPGGSLVGCGTTFLFPAYVDPHSLNNLSSSVMLVWIGGCFGSSRPSWCLWFCFEVSQYCRSWVCLPFLDVFDVPAGRWAGGGRGRGDSVGRLTLAQQKLIQLLNGLFLTNGI